MDIPGFEDLLIMQLFYDVKSIDNCYNKCRYLVIDVNGNASAELEVDFENKIVKIISSRCSDEKCMNYLIDFVKSRFNGFELKL